MFSVWWIFSMVLELSWHIIQVHIFFSKNLNCLFPSKWLHSCQNDFWQLAIPMQLKDLISAVKLLALNNIHKLCRDFKFSILHFKELFHDLINFWMRYFKDSCREITFSIKNFQQRSWDVFNVRRIFKYFNFIFPIKNIDIEIIYKYTILLRKK